MCSQEGESPTERRVRLPIGDSLIRGSLHRRDEAEEQVIGLATDPGNPFQARERLANV